MATKEATQKADTKQELGKNSEPENKIGQFLVKKHQDRVDLLRQGKCPHCSSGGIRTENLPLNGIIEGVFYCFPSVKQYICDFCHSYFLDQETLDDLKKQPVSIPLSACPPELAYLRENFQYFLNVAGRKLGDRFIIEEVKMRR